MTPSLSMTCEVLDESEFSISPMSTSPDQREGGSGSLPLTGTNLGRSRWSSTADGGMTFQPSLPRRSSCDQQAPSLIFFTHITIWTLSMETADCSSPEVERLKSENATLRRHIQTLEAEIARLRDQLISAWGTC